jgi:glycine/D-amino acid oxidase-like deaminating enzyme
MRSDVVVVGAGIIGLAVDHHEVPAHRRGNRKSPRVGTRRVHRARLGRSGLLVRAGATAPPT